MDFNCTDSLSKLLKLMTQRHCFYPIMDGMGYSRNVIVSRPRSKCQIDGLKFHSMRSIVRNHRLKITFRSFWLQRESGCGLVVATKMHPELSQEKKVILATGPSKAAAEYPLQTIWHEFNKSTQ